MSSLGAACAPRGDGWLEGESECLEVRVLWGDVVLSTHFLCGDGSLFVGDEQGSIAAIPEPVLGVRSLAIAAASAGRFTVNLPPGAVARLRDENGQRPMRGPGLVETKYGEVVEIVLGRFEVRCQHGRRCRSVPPVSIAARVANGAGRQVAAAALMHAALLGILAYYTPALAGIGEEGHGRDQILAMRQYLTAAAEREHERDDASREDPALGPPGSGPSAGARAMGAEGAVGKDGARVADRRWAKLGPKDNPAPALDRAGQLTEAAHTGVIDLLVQYAGDPNAPSAGWDQANAFGANPVSAIANMWGPEIGDAAGGNGLGLSGTGRGAGGPGAGVGLDPRGLGLGLPGEGGGRGCPTCRLGPHAPRGPILNFAGKTEVNGRIPAEVIQRVVRQNFGRFRNCYETGLRENPSLAGRVVTKFAVDQRGVVTTAFDAGSALSDKSVVACIVKNFYSVSFPEHEGGLVTVVYPLSLEPQ